MEQKFYKVQLSNGRVLGPLDLDRIKLFVLKEKFTGEELAKLYPDGDWKDIQSFSEIAQLFLKKLDGSLKADEVSEAEKSDPGSIQIFEEPSEPSIEKKPKISAPVKEDKKNDSEATVIVSREKISENVPSEDSEKTVVASKNELVETNLPVEVEGDATPELQSGNEYSNEKTSFISLSQPAETEKQTATKNVSKSNIKKLALTASILAFLVAYLFFQPVENKKESKPDDFKIELPQTSSSLDPQESHKLTEEALKYYRIDNVSGYKKASQLLTKAVSKDPNNVRAISLLASSYINLIDVVKRDEAYFNSIVSLVEMARARGVDLEDTVIADVELYHLLGNPEAALNRIVDFSKKQTKYSEELFYYLALSFYFKGEPGEALKYLSNLDPIKAFSPKVPYLFGLIFEKNQSIDEAIRAYLETIKQSSNHIKSRVRLCELFYKKDNLAESGKYADFVITNKTLASKEELSKAYYYRARMYEITSRDEEALEDLQKAMSLNADFSDALLEFFTVKARLGKKISDGTEKAKMFAFLAEGEKAFKEGNLDLAQQNFYSARNVQYEDIAPLLRLAEVFRKKNDLISVKSFLEKAVKLKPKNAEIYPKYIKVLIETYEFEEASKIISQFKELNPPTEVVDKINGDFYQKQNRAREALAYYKRALSISNSDSQLYISYANLLFKTHQYKDAAFFYGLAQRFDPFNIDATIGIAKSLAEIEGVDKGVQYIQMALQQSPFKAALLNGIAEVYLFKGDYESALKFTNNALQVDKDYVGAYKTRGEIYFAQDKSKEALDAYLTYSNLNPLDPLGYIERYKLFLKKMDLKSARESINQVITNFPKYPGAYYMLAELYKEAQNYESALNATLEEIKVNPTYIPAYVLAANMYNGGKEYLKALELANKALKMEPDYVPALIQAGFSNHMLKTYSAAQALLERAVKADPGNPQIHYRLASLYHDLGNRDRAKSEYKSYLDLFPDAPDRTEVEKYLKQ